MDKGAMFAIEEIAERSAKRVDDAGEAERLYQHGTNQTTPVAALVTEWAASLKLTQKTIDQQTRDVTRMAEHFVNLEALKPKSVLEQAGVAEGVAADILGAREEDSQLRAV